MGERRPRGTLWLWLAYCGALAALLAFHEPWRDEIQAWLLARDSPSLVALWKNTRYEGHPLAWHFLLWVLARLTANPVAMQVLHGLLAAAGAFLFLQKAPFPLPWRAAWVFTYFPLYEYGVLARNYQLTALGFWAALALRQKPRWAGAALALVANSSPMGLLLAPPLALGMRLKGFRLSKGGWFLLSLAWGFALWSCLPPPDYEHARGWFWHWDWGRAYYVIRGLAAAFFPIPSPQVHFWNDPLLFPFAPTPAGAALAIGIATAFLALAGFALPSRVARLLWLAGLAALGGFFYLKFPGTTRHHGFFLLWTLAMLWLFCRPVARSSWRWLLPAALVLPGLAGAAVASWFEVRYPFSAGRQAAGEVVQKCMGLPLVGHPDWAASTVAGYLPHRPILYLTTGAAGTFVRWNLARAQREKLTQEQLLWQARATVAGDFCLLLNAPLAGAPCLLLAAQPLAIVSDEAFWLYRCPPSS